VMIAAMVFISVFAFPAPIFAQTGGAGETEGVEISADDRTPVVVDSEGIVVTATRTQKSVRDAPGAVTVITGEEIEAEPAISVPVLLNNIPGFYSRLGNDFSVFGTSTVRGISGDRFLMMLDGVPVSDPRGGENLTEGIGAGTISRIEAVRGPVSALYGSAMSGAVNIITKMPEKRVFDINTSYGSAFVSGEANRNVVTTNLSYGDKLFDRFSFLLNYNLSRTDGFANQDTTAGTKPGSSDSYPYVPYEESTDTAGKTRYIIGDWGDKAVKREGVSAKLQYEFLPDMLLKFNFLRTYIDVSNGFPHYLNGDEVKTKDGYHSYFSMGYGTPWSRTKYFYNASFETPFAGFWTKLNFSVQDTPQYDQFYTTSGEANNGGGYVNSIKSQSYFTDWQITSPQFFLQTLTGGVTYKHDSADASYNMLNYWRDKFSETGALRSYVTAESGGKTESIGIYLQDEIDILNNLSVYAGARFDWWYVHDGYTNDTATGGTGITDYDAKSKWTVSPKLAVVYSPVKITTVRVSGGRAFSAPSISNLFTSYGKYLANPDLEPEKTWSWDAEVTQNLWKGAVVNAGYFENYIDDLIASNTSNETGDVYKINIGKAETRGIETGFSQELFGFVTLKADYTYTWTKVTKDITPNIEGKELTYTPKHIFNACADIKYAGINFYLGARYASKAWTTAANTDTVNGVSGSIDPYFLLNAKVSYDFTKLAGVRLTPYFAVNNMLNQHYYESSYKAPGASWTLGLDAKY